MTAIPPRPASLRAGYPAKTMKIIFSDMVIQVESPTDAVLPMLVKAKFQQDGDVWVCDRTPFWEAQCRKLANALGCEVVEAEENLDVSYTPYPAAVETCPEPEPEPEPEPGPAPEPEPEPEPEPAPSPEPAKDKDLTSQVAELAATVARLQREVVELKKLEGLD